MVTGMTGMTSYEDGQSACQAGDLAEAERLWLLAAEAGDVRAANDLGVLLAGQDRIPEAEQAWSLAAAAGDSKAIGNLAKLAEQRQDLGEAERLWRRVAELGDCDGAYGVGRLLYEQGAHECAERWLRAAARDGQADAAVILAALLCEQGQADEATEILRTAAGQGHPGAAKNLALLLQDTSGYDSEVDAWLRVAAEAGDAECAMQLAAAWEDHDPEQAAHWRQAARYWMGNAAEGGDVRVQADLGQDLLLAAQAGDPWAAGQLARLCQDRGDPAGAAHWGAMAARADAAPL